MGIPRKIIITSFISEKKKIKTYSSSVGRFRTDGVSLYNDDGQNANNEEGRLNDTVYPQTSDTPETKAARKSGEEYKMETYNFEPCRTVE